MSAQPDLFDQADVEVEREAGLAGLRQARAILADPSLAPPAPAEQQQSIARRTCDLTADDGTRWDDF